MLNGIEVLVASLAFLVFDLGFGAVRLALLRLAAGALATPQG